MLPYTIEIVGHVVSATGYMWSNAARVEVAHSGRRIRMTATSEQGWAAMRLLGKTAHVQAVNVDGEWRLLRISEEPRETITLAAASARTTERYRAVLDALAQTGEG